MTNFAPKKPIIISKMKIIKFLFLLIATCTVSFIADAQKQPSNAGSTIGLTKTGGKVNKRPQAPSLQRITCTYDGEYLVFDFVLPEGQCELTVRSIDNTNVVCETFDSNDLVAEVFVGELSDCEIELTTQKGNTYSGTLYVGNE